MSAVSVCIIRHHQQASYLKSTSISACHNASLERNNAAKCMSPPALIRLKVDATPDIIYNDLAIL